MEGDPAVHGRHGPLDRPTRQRAAGGAHRRSPSRPTPRGRDQHRGGHRRDPAGADADRRPAADSGGGDGDSNTVPIVLGVARWWPRWRRSASRWPDAQTLADVTRRAVPCRSSRACSWRSRPGTAAAHGGNAKFRSEFRSIQPAGAGHHGRGPELRRPAADDQPHGQDGRDHAGTSASRTRGCARTARWRSTAAPPPTT